MDAKETEQDPAVAGPSSHPDIGAFQDRGFTITVVAGSSPQSTIVNTAFANPLAVIVSSPYGDPVEGGVITFTAPPKGPSATLQPGTATIDSKGRASVTAKANDMIGDYLVPASASGVISGKSFSLTNEEAAGTQLVIHTQPSGAATAGSPFSTQPVIFVEDQYGNLETGDNTTRVTASLRVGSGPLLGTTTVTVSGGIATFTNLEDDRAEKIILLFTGPALVKTQSNPITVSPAAATTLSITAPTNVSAGKPLTITVLAFDPYGNVATGYRGTVNFSRSDDGAYLPVSYTLTGSDGGVHSFGNGVALRSSGVQTIRASDVIQPSVTGSTSVDVGGGAMASVVTIAADGGRVRGQVRESMRALALTLMAERLAGIRLD